MTPASNEHPTRRSMVSRFGDIYIVELRAELILIRPKGSRRGGRGEVVVTPGAIYQRALEVRIAAEKKERKTARKSRRSGGA